MSNPRITILPGSNFSWSRQTATDINPIQVLADHGMLHDNGLLSNKIITEYGSFVFSDIEARMRHAELKNAPVWRRIRQYFLRKEPNDIDQLHKHYDQAVYTERELAERMIRVVRLIQPVERLLNRPDLTVKQVKLQLQSCRDAIQQHQHNLRNLTFVNELPALNTLADDEMQDLQALILALQRLQQRLIMNINQHQDCNAELQKWLLKRFDQLNRGFERRIRNVNIYKSFANSGGLTLGRAYDTLQNVKEMMRATEHYYAEVGMITSAMQHIPQVHKSGFSSELYPLKAPAGDALKIAHFFESGKNYELAQRNYRSDKNYFLKQASQKKAPIQVLSTVKNFVQDLWLSITTKLNEELDFSFGNNWHRSNKLSEKNYVLEMFASQLPNVPAIAPSTSNDNMQFAAAPPSLILLSFGDVVTSTAKFAEQFTEFFAGHMSDKRPFSSFVAFIVYGFFGLTTFNPALAKNIVAIATKILSQMTAGKLQLSADSILESILKECHVICKYLGADNSLGERIITNAFVNMKGYLFLSDSVNCFSQAETGFIKEICNLARNNCLTPKSFSDNLESYGIKATTGIAFLMLGLVVGVAGHVLGEYGFPLNKIIDISLNDLKQPGLVFGAAFSGALIALKCVGAFNETMHSLGSQINRAGVPLHKNPLDYALLVVLINGLNYQPLSAGDKARAIDQLARLAREYPGLSQHPLVLPLTQGFHCEPKKTKIADVIWGLIKPGIIAGTWLLSLPRLAINASIHFHAGGWPADFAPAWRTFLRAPIAGWLFSKRVVTSAMTVARMLIRVSVEVAFRFINKLFVCTDTLISSLWKFGVLFSCPADLASAVKNVEEGHIKRSQAVNNYFVNLIGWLDDHIAKPCVNLTLRNAEYTTQRFLSSGSITPKQRMAAYDASLTISDHELNSIVNNKRIRDTTTKVFNYFQINANDDYNVALEDTVILYNELAADSEEIEEQQEILQPDSTPKAINYLAI